jgi:acetyl esterase
MGNSMTKNYKFDFPVKEQIYKVVGDRKLKLYIFEPDMTPSRDTSVILFFNGGSFKKDPITPVQFQYHASFFSNRNMVAICVDYRNGSDEGFTPIQAICDVKSAIRWVRKNSFELGIDPNKVIVCGASAGGYISVSSIMFKDIDDDNSDEYTDHVPNALVVFGAGMDAVDIMSRRYPELLETATEISPLHNIKKCLPHTLWMVGTIDDLYHQNVEFVKLMKKEGNNITLEIYEGMEHGFFNFGRHDNKTWINTSIRMNEFLNSLGL